MAKPKRIIPDFMLQNPNDSFVFLMPVALNPDLNEDIGNSYFDVLVKNLTRNEFFKTYVSPEAFFTHFKFHQVYTGGKVDKKFKTKPQVSEHSYFIDTRLDTSYVDAKLGDTLSDSFIGQLLGWKYTYLTNAKNIKYYCVKSNNVILIIPHYTVAIYYYYRSTVLKEAALRCNLENLYLSYDCNSEDASLIIPNYVPQDDAPFIHRFLCQDTAALAFKNIGTFISAYIKKYKDLKQPSFLENIPIFANFPIKDTFTISTRRTVFHDDGTEYHYVHEILDDDSPIGFSKFTTYFQSNSMVTKLEKSPNISSIPIKAPSQTSEFLTSEHGNKRYKQHSIVAQRKQKCSSLKYVDMSTDKITNKEISVKLRLCEEQCINENVIQSLTASSDAKEKKIRQTRLSTRGKEFITLIEPQNNFEAFHQYLEYMRIENMVDNLHISLPKKMKIVNTGKNGTPNSKCLIHGRSRQYITATFTYNKTHVTLLELENIHSSSTWVISSKEALKEEIYEIFLNHFIKDNMTINQIKYLYNDTNKLQFKTKNHERVKDLTPSDKIKWVIGLLSKI